MIFSRSWSLSSLRTACSARASSFITRDSPWATTLAWPSPRDVAATSQSPPGPRAARPSRARVGLCRNGAQWPREDPDRVGRARPDRNLQGQVRFAHRTRNYDGKPRLHRGGPTCTAVPVTGKIDGYDAGPRTHGTQVIGRPFQGPKLDLLARIVEVFRLAAPTGTTPRGPGRHLRS